MQNIGENIKKHHLIYALMLPLFLALLASFSAPAAAQGPTVTPAPGPVATLTKAAQSESEARAQQAEADRLTAQAIEAQRRASAAYQQAQRDAADARAMLEAQRYQQAGEALGRAEAGIESGQAQLTVIEGVRLRLGDIVAAQAVTITRQADQITLLSGQLRDAQAINQAVTTRLKEAEAQQANPVVVIAAGLAFVFLIGLVIILVIEKWRGNAAPQIISARIVDDDDKPRSDSGYEP